MNAKDRPSFSLIFALSSGMHIVPLFAKPCKSQLFSSSEQRSILNII